MSPSAADRAAVVAAARAWIGTPYHHMADVKGVGCDCAMLLVRVFCDLGLVEPFDPRPYARDWHPAPRRGALSRLPARARARGRRAAARRRDPVQIRPLLFPRRHRHASPTPLTIVHAFHPRACPRGGDRRATPRSPRGCAHAKFASYWSAQPRELVSRQDRDQTPDYTGLQLQTSVSTLPIPIVWGQTKAAANVIWYSNFQTHGGGGGAARAACSSAASLVDLHLHRRPHHGAVRGADRGHRHHLEGSIDLHAGRTRPDLLQRHDAAGGLGLSRGASTPTRRSPIRARPMSAPRAISSATAPTIGNHNFEIIGVLAGTGVNGVDADPAQVVNDFLTNPQYGAGFIAASIDATTLYGARRRRLACRPIATRWASRSRRRLTGQEQGSSILARWLQILNCAAVWSGGELKFIPYGDAAIAAGDVASTVQIAGPHACRRRARASTPPPSIAVCARALNSSPTAASIYAFTGAALTYVGAAAPIGAGATAFRRREPISSPSATRARSSRSPIPTHAGRATCRT